jgi:hypothetical protein
MVIITFDMEKTAPLPSLFLSAIVIRENERRMQDDFQGWREL